MLLNVERCCVFLVLGYLVFVVVCGRWMFVVCCLVDDVCCLVFFCLVYVADCRVLCVV